MKGFIQTDIGLIPKDWIIYNLREIIVYIKGFAFKSSKYKKEGTRIIRVSDLTSNAISDENAVFINESSGVQYKKWKLNENDIIITTVGSKPPIWDSLVGKAVRVGKKHKDALLNQNAVLIRDKEKNHDIQNLIFYSLGSKRYIHHIEEIFRGNANQASITLIELFKFQLAIPSLKTEQQAIAEALSDMDALIAAQEALIAKKHAIKHGVMQELLTGKRRLPGFIGKWKIKKLGEIADIKTGEKNNDDKIADGEFPFFVRSQTIERINTFSFDGEAILVPGEGNIGRIFHYINGKFDYHQRVYKISDFLPNVCGKFIYFVMCQMFNEHAMRNSVKATVDSLRLPTFQKFELLISDDVKEQEKIAEILSEFDQEILVLEEKLNKTKTIKQGMMQELLTGRIRLM